MSIEYCVDLDLDEVNAIEGEAVKVSELSFLGDVDKDKGVVTSRDSGCLDCSISGKVLVVERFRGSTVGAYVLYSLCRRGLGPKAIVCTEPDPVVVAGAALCSIPMVYGVPKQLVKSISSGDRIRLYKGEGGLCISVEKGF